jgi:predicted ABC-type transport system involved in lysophospholipase L1 biosynthesis ATPase subunit
MVFQRPVMLRRSALANVAYGLKLAGVPRGEREAHARAALERVGLLSLADRPARAMSGGEQQRVALARAVANRPGLVLADEPTGNLDSATGAQIVDLLVGLHRRHDTTLILVTHDAALAVHAQRIVELRDGRVVGDRVTP